MLKAKILNGSDIYCPACFSHNFVIYRKIPTGNGYIQNICRCEDCGEHFGYEEDKKGNKVKE